MFFKIALFLPQFTQFNPPRNCQRIEYFNLYLQLPVMVKLQHRVNRTSLLERSLKELRIVPLWWSPSIQPVMHPGNMPNKCTDVPSVQRSFLSRANFRGTSSSILESNRTSKEISFKLHYILSWALTLSKTTKCYYFRIQDDPLVK